MKQHHVQYAEHSLSATPLPPRLRRERLTSTIGAACLTFCVSFVIAFGLLVPSGTAHFKVSVSAYLIQYTLLAGVSGLCFALVGRLVPRFGIRRLIVIGGLITTASIFAMSLTTNLYLFYFFATLHGIGWSACTLVAATIVVNSWHVHRRKGTVMGLVLAGNAVGGTVWGFVLPPVIGNFGWSGGMQLLAVVALVMLVLPGLFLIKNPPRPISAGNTDAPVKLPSLRSAGLVGALMLLIAGTFFICLEGGAIQILPTLLEHRGIDTAKAGTLVSFYAIGGIIAKPLFGFLYDKIGAVRSAWVAALAYLVAFPALALTQSVFSYYLIIPLMALALATFTVLVPLFVADGMGQVRFPDAYGKVMTVGSLGLAIATPLWGLAFDLTGSFTPALYAAAVVGVVGLVLLHLGRVRGKAQAARTAEAAKAEMAAPAADPARAETAHTSEEPKADMAAPAADPNPVSAG